MSNLAHVKGTTPGVGPVLPAICTSPQLKHRTFKADSKTIASQSFVTVACDAGYETEKRNIKFDMP